MKGFLDKHEEKPLLAPVKSAESPDMKIPLAEDNLTQYEYNEAVGRIGTEEGMGEIIP